MALIYVIHNTVNGKVYIGQHTGVNLKARWRCHVWDARNGSKFAIHKAIRKYGESAFKVYALSTFALSQEDLDAQEMYYITKYRAQNGRYGYNMTEGGGGSRGVGNMKGKTHSEATKKRMSASTKAWRAARPGMKNPMSKQTKDKISAAWERPGRKSSMEGKKHSEETLQKMRDAKKVISEETRQKLRVAAQAREAKKRKGSYEKLGNWTPLLLVPELRSIALSTLTVVSPILGDTLGSRSVS